jgi:hypothetical protein
MSEISGLKQPIEPIKPLSPCVHRNSQALAKFVKLLGARVLKAPNIAVTNQLDELWRIVIK